MPEWHAMAFQILFPFAVAADEGFLYVFVFCLLTFRVKEE
jgi:hypothetical protein